MGVAIAFIIGALVGAILIAMLYILNDEGGDDGKK